MSDETKPPPSELEATFTALEVHALAGLVDAVLHGEDASAWMQNAHLMSAYRKFIRLREEARESTS